MSPEQWWDRMLYPTHLYLYPPGERGEQSMPIRLTQKASTDSGEGCSPLAFSRELPRILLRTSWRRFSSPWLGLEPPLQLLCGAMCP